MRELIEQFSNAARRSAGAEQLVGTLAQFFDFLPLPAWIKVVDLNGHVRMFRTNFEYQKQTGLTYEPGHKDEDQWSSEVAEDFDLNDQAVIRTRLPIETREIAPDASGKDVLWAGAKWPIFSPEGDVVGVAGFAIAEPLA
jgi:hypothetical protein